MTRFLAVLGCVVLVGTFGLADFRYAFYYDLTEERDLVVNVMNTLPLDNMVTITVYTAFGEILWNSTSTLGGYVSTYVPLSRFIPTGQDHWGLVTIDATSPVLIALEYIANDALVSVNIISHPLPSFLEQASYWLGVYYNQVGRRTTRIVLMNPWAENTSCSLAIYRQDGNTIQEFSLTVLPYGSAYIDLGKILGQGGYLWGLVDIEMTERPLGVAVEYAGEGVEIVNLSEPYFFQPWIQPR